MKSKFKIAIGTAAAILAVGAGLSSLFAHRVQAQSSELRVMVSDGMKTVVEELTPQIEHATGRKLAAQI